MATLKKPTVFDATSGRLRDLQAGETLDVPTSQTNVSALTNGETGAITVGTVVYISAADTVEKAMADASATAAVFGVVYAPSITAGASGSIATDGPVTATTAQWDALTGDTGGLVAGANYYLSEATAGGLTKTAPSASGEFVTRVGKAVSTTVLELNIADPYELA
jgi:hypothetical protein